MKFQGWTGYAELIVLGSPHQTNSTPAPSACSKQQRQLSRAQGTTGAGAGENRWAPATAKLTLHHSAIQGSVRAPWWKQGRENEGTR